MTSDRKWEAEFEADPEWERDPEKPGHWRLRPEVAKQRTQRAMTERAAACWERLAALRDELVTASHYARDPELHKLRVILDAVLDDERIRQIFYARANKRLRGGNSKRRHGSPRWDAELLRDFVETESSIEAKVRAAIGVIPDLGLLPAPDFVFDPDDVPRIVERIREQLVDQTHPGATYIAKQVLVYYGANQSEVDDLFE